MKKQEAPKPLKKTGTNGKMNESSEKKTKDSAGYPLYPDSDDIYSKSKEEQDIDPEDVTSKKPNPDFEEDDDDVKELDSAEMGDDLDVPGSELDDDDERAGNEDEENNYYSIGGDRHNDLDDANEDDY